MYLNHTKIWTQRLIYGLAALFTTFLAAVFILAIFINIANTKGTPEFIYYITIVFIFIDVIFIKGFRKTFRAARLNRIFEKETEGLISIEDTANAMKMKQNKFVASFTDFIGRDLLKNCSLYAEDPTYILLENGATDIRSKYAVVHCTQCGAPNAIRLGYNNSCKYCSAIIQK